MNTEQVYSFIKNHINSHSDLSKVDAIPLPCGAGKSTAVKALISDAVLNNKGLIVVTDAIDRMEGYVTDYAKRNRDKIAVLKSETVKNEYKTLSYKPVVILTTQRYFSLEPKEIEALTAFKSNDRWGNQQTKNRSVILFDERPYTSEKVQITIGTFNEIDTVFHEGLDNTIDETNKTWLISQWENARLTIQSVIADYEARNSGAKLEVWHERQEAMTENDERFLKLINSYSKQLNKYYRTEFHKFNVVKIIRAIYELFTEGATFTSQKINKGNDEVDYCNYFTVVLDNSNKLVNIGAKVFVLDGTADIDPAYDLDYISIVDCTQFQRSLKNLTINIVNIPNAGKTALSNNQSMVDSLIKLIKRQPNEPVIFTYQNQCDRFKQEFERVDYFGNIRGKNEYRDCTEFVQVGLNRYPDINYKLTALFNKLFSSSNEETTIVIGKNNDEQTLTGLQLYDDVLLKELLVDIEQNIFRSKIRNIDCNDKVNYTLYFNSNRYHELVELIKARFEPLGATVNILDTPPEIALLKTKNRKTKESTKAQLILDWFAAQSPERIFKISEMLSELQITAKQFKIVRAKNKAIQQLFESKRIGKGIYQV
jgi:hypothetical protein